MRNTAQHAAHLPAVPRTILSACICVCNPAAAVGASGGSPSEIPALAGNCQHRTDRGPQPDPHGPQRTERPLRQVPIGAAEVPQQGVLTLALADFMFGNVASPPPDEEFCDLCVSYVFRRSQRPWAHSGGNSLIFTCTRRAEEFWRSPCGTETLGGGTTSLDGQSDLHLCGSALFNTMMNGDFIMNFSLIIKFSKCKKL